MVYLHDKVLGGSENVQNGAAKSSVGEPYQQNLEQKQENLEKPMWSDLHEVSTDSTKLQD